jgi:HK97 gp10 family phage protein
MVTILGLPQLQAKLLALPMLVHRAAEQGRARGLSRIASSAAAQAPRRTGAMASSIKTSGEAVTVSVPYARFQEFGTSRMAANPFLGPALEQEQESAVDDIAEAVRVSLIRL